MWTPKSICFIDDGAEDAGGVTDAPEGAGNDAPTIAAEVPDTPQPDWPDDWREKMARGLVGKSEGEEFEKELKRLGRFKSADNVFKSMREFERKMSTGELKAADAPFPVEGTDEEKAAWREARGLPGAPEGYLEDLDGLVVGEEDKPLVDDFIKAVYERGGSKDEVKAALGWYYQAQEKMEAERAEADAQYRAQSVETLRQEMGADMPRIVGGVKNWLAEEGSEELRDNLLGARLADGTLLGDNPVALKFLADQMLKDNPLVTVVPNAGGNQTQLIADEIAKIEGVMQTDFKAYSADKQMQARYYELLDARDKLRAA